MGMVVLFGMPSLHLFTFLMFFFNFLVTILFWSQLQLDLTLRRVFFWFSFTWKLTTVLRQLHDHPSITKAVGRLFLSIAISSQLNPAPYLQHKPWQQLAHVLREETMPAVHNSQFHVCTSHVWSLVWERDYVCACIQHLKMASYAMDSNRAELRTALSIRVKLRVVMALSTWTVFEISMLNFVVLTRRQKMALAQPHTFALNCLPCGFWALVSLADHKETQGKNKHLNKPLSYLWWNYTTFP